MPWVTFLFTTLGYPFPCVSLHIGPSSYCCPESFLLSIALASLHRLAGVTPVCVGHASKYVAIVVRVFVLPNNHPALSEQLCSPRIEHVITCLLHLLSSCVMVFGLQVLFKLSACTCDKAPCAINLHIQQSSMCTPPIIFKNPSCFVAPFPGVHAVYWSTGQLMCLF